MTPPAQRRSRPATTDRAPERPGPASRPGAWARARLLPRRVARKVGQSRWGVLASTTLIAALVLTALAANLLRPDQFLVTDFAHVLESPSWQYPFGTDLAGRDVLAMVLRGMRVSFAVTALAAIVAVVIGSTVGIVAGAAGGKVDATLMRVVDFLTSQNHLLFTLLIAVLVRPVVGGGGAVMLAVGLTHWTSMARIVRSEVLSLRQRPFVRAAIGVGAGRRHLARRHLAPHLAPSMALGLVLLFPHAIFHEAALSFLGLGLPPDQPSLGTLLAAGQDSMVQGGWWMVVFPGLVIVTASIATGALGERWRELSQPRWRSELQL